MEKKKNKGKKIFPLKKKKKKTKGKKKSWSVAHKIKKMSILPSFFDKKSKENWIFSKNEKKNFAFEKKNFPFEKKTKGKKFCL